MKIIEIENRTSILIHKLVNLWQESVKATHLFLSDAEIEEIRKYVPQALKAVSTLVVAVDESLNPLAFIGIENKSVEMLFVAPEERNKGIGKEKYGVKRVSVNEQNPEAKGFYEHMGFETYKRTDVDEQGRAYPVLYMKRCFSYICSCLCKSLCTIYLGRSFP